MIKKVSEMSPYQMYQPKKMIAGKKKKEEKPAKSFAEILKEKCSVNAV